MAAYSYKKVRDIIPQYIIDSIHDYDGDPGYDGDLHLASAKYIYELKRTLQEVLSQMDFSENIELKDDIKKVIFLDEEVKREFELKQLSK